MNILIDLFISPASQAAVAGSLGGVARWLLVIIADKKLAARQAVAMIALGALVGMFVSPTFEPAVAGTLSHMGFAVDPEKLPAFSAFAFGSVAIGVMGLIIDRWFNRKKPLGEPSIDPQSAGAAKETGL